jgi:hypothetical protein
LEDGACPEVLHIDNSIASFDEDTCTITTNLPEGRNTYDENLLL